MENILVKWVLDLVIKTGSDILKLLKENQEPLKITIPPKVESEILVTSKPLLAEIKMQEMIKRSPRAPVWVRFRWND